MIKAVQWNIGGGYIRGEDSASGYDTLDLSYIAQKLADLAPDVVALQEAHSKEQGSQAEELAGTLGLEFVNYPYDNSHIEKGQKLSLAILAKGLITGGHFELFDNPLFKAGPAGQEWVSHNKGVLSCSVAFGDRVLEVKTLHTIPYHKFGIGIEDGRVRRVFADIDAKLGKVDKPTLLQGDFNINAASMRPYFPRFFAQGVEEYTEDRPTTPRDKNYDHVIYKGLTLISSKTLTDVRTDHYVLVSEFAF